MYDFFFFWACGCLIRFLGRVIAHNQWELTTWFPAALIGLNLGWIAAFIGWQARLEGWQWYFIYAILGFFSAWIVLGLVRSIKKKPKEEPKPTQTV
jgi:hypothetical protein